MKHVEIFTAHEAMTSCAARTVETQLNAWLTRHKPQNAAITTSVAASGPTEEMMGTIVMATVVYEDNEHESDDSGMGDNVFPFHRVSLEITTPQGDRAFALGIRWGSLAVNHDGHEWHITHIPTGISICQCPSEAAAFYTLGILNSINLPWEDYATYDELLRQTLFILRCILGRLRFESVVLPKKEEEIDEEEDED